MKKFIIALLLFVAPSPAHAYKIFSRFNPNAVALWKFNEGSGAGTFENEVAKSSMTLLGNCAWVTQKQTVMSASIASFGSRYAQQDGQGISIPNTTGEHFESTNTAIYDLFTGSGTFVVQVKPALISGGGYRTILNYCIGQGGTSGFSFDIDNTNHFNITFCGCCGSNWTYVLPDLYYHRVAMTYDSFTRLAKLYVDGVFKAQLTTNGVYISQGNNFGMQIGEKNNSGHAKFSGSVDEFGVFRGIWSADDVQRDFLESQPLGRAIVPAGWATR